ncbi:MAG TPA: XRE family transcriptional regulator [Micromonosporaceae bacterium]
MFYGERVRQVREMHRITQQALVEMVPTLTQSRLSRIESDLAEPDSETVALLSVMLGVTTEFFSRPPVPGLAAHSPQLRARSKLTQREKSSALQWARLINEVYEELKRAAKPLPVRLEPADQSTPAQAARALRPLLGFGANEPLPYLLLAVERLGVTILGIPHTTDALDAFCAWRDETPVIGVLGNVPGDRLRFSVAHELGHLILHRGKKPGRELEREADEFAAELLTPLAALRFSMPKQVTLSSLTMLKTQWGVSIKALIRRARELNAIDQERAISLYKQISARGWNRAEPGYVPREKPRALRKLIEISYGPGVSVERLALDAQWSQELTLQILNEHATADELPFHPPPSSCPGYSNVVDLRPRTDQPQSSSMKALAQSRRRRSL